MIRTKSVYHLGEGVKAMYLAGNQAFLLMWHNSVIKGPAPYNEIRDYYERLYRPQTNPPSRRGACEYCRLLNSLYTQADSKKARRRILARFKLHRKALHQNPLGGTRRLAIKAGIKTAKVLYSHFKNKGVPSFVMNKIPGSYRSIVEEILKYNGVKVSSN